ncbi:MAG TPA: hypothetical protein PKG88_02555 [Bacteroidales bacterium]|nr:hypothetical protein [Bacteroidales bacterium]HPS71116.1 hypothetical protein [Bacteroidales bacterium]
MKNENTKIGFALKTIKTEQFAIFEENYASKKETGLTTEIQFKIDQKNSQIGVFLTLEFFQMKKVFIKIQVSCHFKINEESWICFANKNESKVIIPKEFLAHLAMITVGTTRGILFSKIEGTPFSIFIVPTINVAEMIKGDAIFDLSEIE